jgi:hypothetical protein
LIQPKLAPAFPPAVLVMTRPCQAAVTASLADPPLSFSTITSTYRFKNAKSSAKLEAGTLWANGVDAVIDNSAAVMMIRVMDLTLAG